MANIPIWPGSSSFHPGDTPFGFYDFNPDFQRDADRVAKFCALRLGYPIENVELQDINFYAAFEEAVTVYSNELFESIAVQIPHILDIPKSESLTLKPKTKVWWKGCIS